MPTLNANEKIVGLAMKKLAEAFRVNAHTLNLIQRVARIIEPDESIMADWYEAYVKEHADRIAFDLEMVEKYAQGSEVIVDLASVPLLLVAALQERGKSAFGVDIDPGRFSKSISRLGLTIHKCDIELEPLPFEDASVDVIIFNEIFEHLRINPVSTFRELHRILKPSGVLLLSTPNGLSLRHCVRLVAKRRIGPDIFSEYEKLSRLGHMGHVREYCANEVADFLVKLDFSLDHICFRGRYNRQPYPTNTNLKSVVADGFCFLFSALRPYFSIVARKPGF